MRKVGSLADGARARLRLRSLGGSRSEPGLWGEAYAVHRSHSSRCTFFSVPAASTFLPILWKTLGTYESLLLCSWQKYTALWRSLFRTTAGMKQSPLLLSVLFMKGMKGQVVQIFPSPHLGCSGTRVQVCAWLRLAFSNSDKYMNHLGRWRGGGGARSG